MSKYHENKMRARTRNTDPSMTDQSQARDTDINVIVGRFQVTGRVPSAPTPAMSGDFSEIPLDGLRGFIHRARKLAQHLRNLPECLRGMPPEELLALTPEQLKDKLTPPPTPEPPKGEPK